MKDFCVDLEIAKELKENGFLQFSYFNWYLNDDRYFLGTVDILDPFEESMRVCSAPTAEEILKEIPKNILKVHDIHLDKNVKANDFSNNLARWWLYLKKKDI